MSSAAKNLNLQRSKNGVFNILHIFFLNLQTNGIKVLSCHTCPESPSKRAKEVESYRNGKHHAKFRSYRNEDLFSHPCIAHLHCTTTKNHEI